MSEKKTDAQKRKDDDIYANARYRMKCMGCGREQWNLVNGNMCVKCGAPTKKLPKN